MSKEASTLAGTIKLTKQLGITMVFRGELRIFALLVALMTGGVAHSQDRDSETASTDVGLTPADHIAIQQLSAQYAFLIDSCVNGGYDFADLFTDDGQFSVADDWGSVPDERRFAAQGRDALAVAAGGGPEGCRDPTTLMGYGISHIVVNHAITPSADGANGKSYLLAIGVGGVPTQIELQGGYEDVYVETADGWRIKSRIHVFPNIEQSVQFGSGGTDSSNG